MNLAAYLSKQPRGAGQRLAQAIGAHGPDVSMWASGSRPVPLERCPQIERSTGGAVTCEELNPELNWRRIPDPTWPWHPDGRPLIDPLPIEPSEDQAKAEEPSGQAHHAKEVSHG